MIEKAEKQELTNEEKEIFEKSSKESLEAYSKLLILFSEKFNTKAKTFKELYQLITKENKKVAHNSISRGIKRWWLESKPGFLQDIPSHGIRAATTKAITSCYFEFNELLNVLEKPGIQSEEVFQKIKISFSSFAEALELVYKLGELQNSAYFREQYTESKKRELKKINTEYLLKLRKTIHEIESIYTSTLTSKKQD